MPAARLYTKTFYLGFAYNFFLSLNFSNNAIYPLYVEHHGGGAEQIGLFMGAFSIAAVAGRPLVGYLIDRWGSKRILILGSLFLALPSLGYYLLIDEGLTYLVWALRLLQGFGFGAHFTAYFTFVGNVAPKHRNSEAMAKYGISGMIGHMVGPLIGERVATHLGLPQFFLMMTVFGLLATATAALLNGREEGQATERPTLKGTLHLFTLPMVPLAIVLSMMLAAASTSISSFLAPLSLSRGITGFGLLYTAFAIAGTGFRLIGSHWSDRFGLRYMMIPGFFFYALGLGTLAMSHNLVFVIIAGFLCGLGHGITFPAVVSMGYTLAPRNYAGSSMALFTGIMDLAGAMNALILGQVAGLFSYDVVYPISALGPVAALVLLIISVVRNPEKLKKKQR